jgi:molybdopterin-containing oxidoreductase family iron-sulfur binding subunit
MNEALGNVGTTVVYHEAPGPNERGVVDLAQALNADQINALVILGGNPVYNAPADLNWATAQRKAKNIVRLGYYEDETFERCDWHLPLAHYLESWGDARTPDGTVVSIQPLIEPLFGGITELEVLARVSDLGKTNPHEIVRDTFAALAGGDDLENNWRRFLHDGFLPNSAAKPANVQLNLPAVAQAISAYQAAPPPSVDNLEVVFHRDHKLDDGRYSNNGWLQELPDPITKVAWDNPILLSRKTASELSLRNGNVISLELGGRRIEGPV